MTQAARSTLYDHRHPIPPWIVGDENFHKLKSPQKHTLQGICNSCNESTLCHASDLCHESELAHASPGAVRDLVGAFGGQPLMEACGCNPRTFWRHLKKLEALGYVVTLSRGGTIGGKNYGNQYGVPGQRGSLQPRRANREMRRMIRGADDRFRPDVIQPGDQITIWPEHTTQPGVPENHKQVTGVSQDITQNHSEQEKVSRGSHKSVTGGVSKCHEGEPLKLSRGSCQFDKMGNKTSEKVSRGVCQSVTPIKKTMEKNHGHGVVCQFSGSSPETAERHGHGVSKNGSTKNGHGPQRGWPGRHVDHIDLTDPRRLSDLFSLAYKSGMMEGSQDNLLWFFTAAEHALKHGSNPPALFRATILNNRRSFPSIESEERARKRMNKFLYED